MVGRPSWVSPGACSAGRGNHAKSPFQEQIGGLNVQKIAQVLVMLHDIGKQTTPLLTLGGLS